MKTQLIQAIQNLEQVVCEAGYECKNIVRLNIYTASTGELWPHFDILQNWISKHNIKQALTFMEVTHLSDIKTIKHWGRYTFSQSKVKQTSNS